MVLFKKKIDQLFNHASPSELTKFVADARGI